MNPSDPAIHLPATIAQNARTVERGFWKKLLAVAGRIPFADDLYHKNRPTLRQTRSKRYRPNPDPLSAPTIAKHSTS